MKKLIALLTAFAMLLSIGSAAVADTNPQAEALAKQQVPATSILTSTGEDDTHYEFVYEDKVTNTKYKVDITKNPLSLRKVESKIQSSKGSRAVVLKEEEIHTAVGQMYQGAKINDVYVQKDNGLFEYLAVFEMDDDNRLYRVHLNPARATPPISAWPKPWKRPWPACRAARWWTWSMRTMTASSTTKWKCSSTARSMM